MIRHNLGTVRDDNLGWTALSAAKNGPNAWMLGPEDREKNAGSVETGTILVSVRRPPISFPYPKGNGKHNDQGTNQHPILDVNAKDAESLNKHMHGRFPRSGVK